MRKQKSGFLNCFEFIAILTPEAPLFGITLHSFSADQPQNFSKSAFGSNITKFERERAPKKREFWSNFSKKCLKTPFLACHCSFLEELGKSIWST